MPDDKTISAKLAGLSPEARARVEAQLKNHIDAEIASGGSLRTPGGAAASFSRGIFFSRVASHDSMAEKVLPQVAEMNEEQFANFASRLAKLRDIGGGGPK